MAEKKEKRYVSDNVQLMAEWDWDKNLEFDPARLTCGSNIKVWWRCNQGHEWQAKVNSRNRGSGCPYCFGRYAVIGENDLLTVNPTLAREWNYSKNGELLPEQFMPNSHISVWWKCSEGHEWEAKIDNRSNGRGCPYCSGQKVLLGYNDLQTINPDLAKEWNYEKNGNLMPEAVSANCGQKVWWRCNSGHEWQAMISNRNKGRGCPYCSGLYAIKGKNDLKTVYPLLVQEWNYVKNGEQNPEDFTANSGQKVWWKCNKGHEWQATISNRANGRGCPVCNSERTTSFPEYALLYYLKKYDLEVVHSYKDMGYELDIYIPSLQTAIEYDGGYWHKDKAKKDIEKNKKCKADGITLYRIREELPLLNDSSIDFAVQKSHIALSGVISTIIGRIVGSYVDVDLERDFIAIESLREYTEKAKSLLTLKPQLAVEWNYEKNGYLKPENLTLSSNKKVWWKCSKGHEWQATINSRNRGNGCPYCSGRLAIKGENDLLTLNPVLAAEWNYSKNHSLLPEHCTPNSHEKVWWLCKEGHEWQAVIKSRNKGTGCPECYRKRK